jgi:hypothetical protein
MSKSGLILIPALFLVSSVLAQEPLGNQVVLHSEMRPWQVRRAESQTVIIAGLAKPGSPAATKALDALLTDFESHPVARTPLENLDLIGKFYVEKDGVEACLSVVIMNSVLGWYDALRFGSVTGRAEIVDNEHFFGRVYILGGKAASDQVMGLLKSNPKKLKDLVEQGLGFAEKYKETKTYDRQWPLSFGMERVLNTMGGHEEVKPLPEAEWENAWKEARNQVRSYYGIH